MTMTDQRVSHGRSASGSADTLARGLGWFSIALGVAEVLAPRTLARTLGMEGSEPLLRAYGLREIATGVGILAAKDPAPWIWGRVGGDALDIATLTAGLSDQNPQKQSVGVALAAVTGVTLLDVACAQALSADGQASRRPMRDYSRRSGLPRPPEQMRGAARDFEVPADMRIPELLRPYSNT
jgi:hypothetical protein